MRFSVATAALFFAGAAVAQSNEELLDQLQSALTEKFTGTIVTPADVQITGDPGSVIPPDHPEYVTILDEFITAGPASVLGELFNPQSRSSILSDIKDGHTPEWFSKLPTAFQAFITAGTLPSGFTLPKSLPMPTGFTIPTVDPSSGPDGVASGTSSGFAPKVTGGALGAGIAGVVGLVGLVAAL